MADNNKVSLQFPVFNETELSGSTGNYILPKGTIVFVARSIDGKLKDFMRVGDGSSKLKDLEDIGVDDHLKIQSLIVGTGEASDKSVAEGYNTKATGPHSHAEGSTTEALGQSSHAEGWKTKVQANAEGGHAEGYMSIAKGEASHAEGSAKEVSKDVWENPTIAEGFASHAEGVSTKAVGQGSHSEGYGSEAKSQWSHAEGWETEANGAHSHAEGSTTKTGSDSAHAEGWYSQANGEASHAEGATTIASAFGAHAEGGPENYTESDGTYTIIGPTTASGEYAHAEGQGTTASGKASHAGGHGTIASGDYQTVIGTYNEEDSSALFIIGDGSSPDDGDRHNILKVKENSTEINSNLSVKGIVDIKSNAGSSIFQVGTYQVTINKPVKVNSSTFSLNNKQVATQEYVQTKIAEAELAGGDIDTSNLVTKIELEEAVQDAMQGYVATDINDDECYEAIQIDITADDKLTLSGKNGSQKIILENGVQIVTSGAGTHTDKLTTSNELKTTGSFIIGEGEAADLSIAGGTKDIDTYGEEAGLTPTEILALKAAIASSGGVDLKNQVKPSKATAPMSIALGVYNESASSGAISLGYGNKNSGFNSTAVGAINEVTGNSAFAYGYKNIVSGDFGVAFGQENQAGEMGFAGGVKSHATGKGAFAFGNETQATNEYAHAEGGDTTASGARSHAEGSGTFATGARSHAEGTETVASGTASHAEGGPRIDSTGKPWSTIASGNYSHAEGAGTKALGHASHAEGEKTIASDYAHAEGYGTNAKGPHSHAEGSTTRAYGVSTHAEGWNTQAGGFTGSGDNITYTGEGAHAEGYKSIASGEASHAEGSADYDADTEVWGDTPTTASGFASHAEGIATIASGKGSHAGGHGTIASTDYQTVVGTYNVEDGEALFIVGNGDADNHSNAFIVNKDGTATLSKGPSEDMNVATKAYVDGVFSDIDFSGLVTEDMLDGYYTKSQTEAYVDDAIKTVDFSGLVTEDMLDGYYTKSQTEAYVDDAIKTVDFSGLVTEDMLDGYYTKSQTEAYVDDAIKTVDFSGLVTEDMLDGYVTESALSEVIGTADDDANAGTIHGKINGIEEEIDDISTTADDAYKKAFGAETAVSNALTGISKVLEFTSDYQTPTAMKGPFELKKIQDYATYLLVPNKQSIHIGDSQTYTYFVTDGEFNAFNASLNKTLKSKADQSQIAGIQKTADDAIAKANQADSLSQSTKNSMDNLNAVIEYNNDSQIAVKKTMIFADGAGIQLNNVASIELKDQNKIATQDWVYKNTITKANYDTLEGIVDTYSEQVMAFEAKIPEFESNISTANTTAGNAVSIANDAKTTAQIVANTIGQNSETSGNTVFARINQMEGLYEGLNNTVTTHGTEITNIKTSLTNGVKYIGTTNHFTNLRSDVHTGDFYRVSGEFKFGNETAHVGDILIATKNSPATNTSDWDLIHTEMDSDTWKQNTASSDGYVTKGSGNANKVWKTDGSGNPAWRDDEDTVYVHPTSGVSQGTYTKVTVDQYGHIKSAWNPTTLADYGITDAATQASLNAYAKKANTLDGYGITNAYTKTQVDTKLNDYMLKTDQSAFEARIQTCETTVEGYEQEIQGFRNDMSNVLESDTRQDIQISNLLGRVNGIPAPGDTNVYYIETSSEYDNSLTLSSLGWVTTIYVCLSSANNACEPEYAYINLPFGVKEQEQSTTEITYKISSTSPTNKNITLTKGHGDCQIVVGNTHQSNSGIKSYHGVVEIKIYKMYVNINSYGHVELPYIIDWKVIE